MVWEIELAYVILFGVGMLLSGIVAVVGSIWRYGRKMAVLEEDVSKIARVERLLTKTAMSLREHVAEANERDRQLQRNHSVIEERFNRLFNGKH